MPVFKNWNAGQPRGGWWVSRAKWDLWALPTVIAAEMQMPRSASLQFAGGITLQNLTPDPACGTPLIILLSSLSRGRAMWSPTLMYWEGDTGVSNLGSLGCALEQSHCSPLVCSSKPCTGEYSLSILSFQLKSWLSTSAMFARSSFLACKAVCSSSLLENFFSYLQICSRENCQKTY